MVDLLTPDVYVQEVPAGPRPIQAVGTRTAGFIGIAPKADAHRGEATAVNNWLQFTREFTEPDNASTPLSNAVFGFFQNGGSRCFIVNLRRGDNVDSGLRALEAEDEIAMVAAPSYTDVGDYAALLSHCENMGDRVAILDGPLRVDDIEQLTRVATATPEGVTSRRANRAAAGERAAAGDR